jgi:hypothetical protein
MHAIAYIDNAGAAACMRACMHTVHTAWIKGGKYIGRNACCISWQPSLIRLFTQLSMCFRFNESNAFS